MNKKAPSYELRSVQEDGTRSEAQIIPITQVPWKAGTGRRGFLGSGVAIASVLAMATGCATRKKRPAPAPPEAVPASTPTPTPPPSKKGKKNAKVKVYNSQTHTWEFRTLPCGSPIPPGAICTCNCVPTTVVRHTSSSYCSCNKVCTCVPVYY